MKILKSAAMRATALLLLFAIIAAVILYEAGVYDIAFIRRPVVTQPEDSNSEEDTDLPQDTTDGDTTSPSTEPGDTTEADIIPPKPPADLNEILSLSEATALGYTLSSSRFDSKSILTRLNYDWSKKASVFSLNTEKIETTVFYMTGSGLISTRVETSIVDKPCIRLYFGLILLDNGKTTDIYNSSGKRLVKKFSGELVGALSDKGNPVVKIKNSYYEIDSTKGLSSAIDSSRIRFLPLAFDHPRDYGMDASYWYPYSAYVNVYTEITPEAPTTSPDNTEPDTTVQNTTDATPPETDTTNTDTTETDTTETDTTEIGTTATDATETSTDGPSDTTTQDTSIHIILDEALSENTAGASQDIAKDDPAETSADSSTASSGDTVSDTSSPSLSETTESASNGTTGDTPVITPPQNNTIMIDGQYYQITQKLMWGYKNAQGETVIEPQFASAYPFSSDGLAAVTDFEGSLFYIDTKGKEVVSLRKKVHIYPSEMSGIRIRQFYFEPVTNGLESLGTYYFDMGYTMVRYCWVSNFNMKQIYRNEFRLVDTSGKVFDIPGGYSLKNYSDGILLLEKDGRYGYMDTEGSWVCPAVFQKASPFLQGLAVAVNEEGKYGMIDRAGNEVLPFVFDYLSNPSDGKIAAFSAERGWEIYGVARREAS